MHSSIKHSICFNGGSGILSHKPGLNSLDAVYLDLHGAMVVESFEDGEGELLCRVRAVTGPDMPLVVSLDPQSPDKCLVSDFHMGGCVMGEPVRVSSRQTGRINVQNLL